MKKFYVELYDNDEDETTVWCVETNKTVKKFEKAYNDTRNAWYEEEDPDCLAEYLKDRLEEQGFTFYKVEYDIALKLYF